MTRSEVLPNRWELVRVSEVADVNPPRQVPDLPTSAEVTFVAMRDVAAHLGGVNIAETRAWEEVHKGYTQFREGDVLYAKITPCMENGKAAVAPALTNGWGYGSTEFHILRPHGTLSPKWLAYHLYREDTRREARAIMTGSAGQLRVPSKWLAESQIPIPSITEQIRITDKIEELFTQLDAAVAALERVRLNLKRYRASVLKAAVEGKLKEAWRTEHPDVEPASDLLQRVLAERRQRWKEAELAKYSKTGRLPPKEWQAKYREPEGPDIEGSPRLPEGWCWTSLEQLVARSEYGTSVKCSYDAGGPPVLRIPNMSRGEIATDDMKYATTGVELAYKDALQPGDILMCRTNGSIGLIGRTVLVRQALNSPHTFASYLLRFRLVATKVLPEWVNLYASSPRGRAFIESHAASSAGQHNISLSLIHRMPLPLPTISEMQAIIDSTDQALSIMKATETEVEAGLKRCSSLRQAILARAFKGKLVPQDPTDEPANLLLARLSRRRPDANPISSAAPVSPGECCSEPA